MLVGGTGLYVRAVVDAVAVPGTDPNLRAAFERRTASAGRPGAGVRGARRPRRRCRGTHRSDEPSPYRPRAEVIELTGRPFSSFGPGLPTTARPPSTSALVGMTLPSDISARRIARRLEHAMRGRVRRRSRRPPAPARRAVAHGAAGDRLQGAPRPRRGRDRALDAAFEPARAANSPVRACASGCGSSAIRGSAGSTRPKISNSRCSRFWHAGR